MKVEFEHSYEPTGPFGAKSISEIACNGAAPAIGIAIHDACGVWLRSWPMTPEKILKALGKINLSLYSMFAMLGGMALPFAVGIIFFKEELTLGKVLCFVIVALALVLTVKREKGGKGYIWYAGVFVLNGLSGVLSTVFQQAPFEKTSAAGYSVLTAAVMTVLSAVLIPFVKGEKRKMNKRAALSTVCNGVLGRVANWLLLIALAHLPASAQYPFVTGGVMICSTVICFFTPDKPGKREIAAVAVSFVGLIILMFVP